MNDSELNEELYHHGILGQKWGKRNGPPYPLDYKKLSPEEKELAKADAIRRGDIEEVNYNRKYFTDNEIRQTIERFKLNSTVDSMVNEMNRKPSNIEKVANVVAKVETVADIANSGMHTWNTFAKMANGLLGKELPIISDRGENLAALAKIDAQKAKAAAESEILKTIATNEKSKYDYLKAKEDMELLKYKQRHSVTDTSGYYDDYGQYHKTSQTATDRYGNKSVTEWIDHRKDSLEYIYDSTSGKEGTKETKYMSNGSKYVADNAYSTVYALATKKDKNKDNDKNK